MATVIYNTPYSSIAVAPLRDAESTGADKARSHAWRRLLLMIDAFIGLQARMPALDVDNANEGFGWSPLLAFAASIGVLGCAFAANFSRSGAPFATPLFYASCALFLLPMVARVVHPAPSRAERLTIVLTATLALFLVRLVRAPVAFVDHDEFLHWLTTTNILEQGHLFTPNPLLPVSPLYPGMEIVTSAIVGLTGLPVFASALILLCVARMIFMAALLLVYEKLSGSSRVAAIAAFVYMGCSTFLIFDAHFSYESLAVTFVAVVWLGELIAAADPSRAWTITLLLTTPMLFALGLTHHMTAFFCAAILAGVAILEQFRRDTQQFNVRAIFVAGGAVLFPLIWSHGIGDPTIGYLGPVFSDGFHELARLLSFEPGRRLFVSDDGALAPAWQRWLAVASVGAICLGLSAGFFRSLRTGGAFSHRAGSASSRGGVTRRSSSPLIVLTLLTLAFPVSVLFRLTRSGWEIGNRVGALSFFGVGLVVAIGVAALWQRQSRSPARAALLGAVGSIIIIGGIISGGGNAVLAPAHFQVSADQASIEPMDIEAAKWTHEWLGPGNLFAADRINRLLLATYGRQDVATTLSDSRDTSVAVLASTLGVSERNVLRQVGIQYLLVDLRISTALPVVGVYFDGAVNDRGYLRPPEPRSLLKFDTEPNVSRPFDNGYQIIYDLRDIDATR